ncbi:MAG TPA: hypothetical protein VEK38_00725 [Candidatus Bathyarchaeia archaeon]|nr:hypothetical protein [Candidatus Bathyarchaeia archaeon]
MKQNIIFSTFCIIASAHAMENFPHDQYYSSLEIANHADKAKKCVHIRKDLFAQLYIQALKKPSVTSLLRSMLSAIDTTQKIVILTRHQKQLLFSGIPVKDKWIQHVNGKDISIMTETQITYAPNTQQPLQHLPGKEDYSYAGGNSIPMEIEIIRTLHYNTFTSDIQHHEEIMRQFKQERKKALEKK